MHPPLYNLDWYLANYNLIYSSSLTDNVDAGIESIKAFAYFYTIKIVDFNQCICVDWACHVIDAGEVVFLDIPESVPGIDGSAFLYGGLRHIKRGIFRTAVEDVVR